MGHSNGSPKTNYLNLSMRLLQVIDGLVVVGLYASDLSTAMKANKYADGKWVSTPFDPKTGAITSNPPEICRLLTTLKVFAVVTGALASFTALVYAFVAMFADYRNLCRLWVWEMVIWILFAALSGIFGRMYLPEAVEMESGIQRMKNAVIFDLIGLVLWLTSTAFAFWIWSAPILTRYHNKASKV